MINDIFLVYSLSNFIFMDILFLPEGMLKCRINKRDDNVIAFFLCVCRIRDVAKTHKVVEQELAHAVNASAAVLTEAFPSKPSSPEVELLIFIQNKNIHHKCCHYPCPKF